MKKYYILLLLFWVAINYAQQGTETLIVDKAWLNESEEWSDYSYSGKIVFLINRNSEEGSLRLGNYDFLYDFCEGKPKFSNKAAYNSAEFSHPRKISSSTDKQGIVNTTYEGTLIFQLDKDYYSVIAIVTLLEKGGNILGAKMHLKESSRKEFAFSLKTSS
ncbi:hypothetical protein [Flavobacterium limi]|uniref:DUF4251 domain-containing protein n=1 Tax=Flavobacterium limi TaxID=2045105 RepID=A0ABQ1TP82_9FLAO|nr:hypothetical protein [Flavobacterium limi]GGF00419.1 hypothetical protein GCM10011518_07270 [Flavobacterium limi]